MSLRYVITRAEVKGIRPLVCAICEDHVILEAQCVFEDGISQILNNIYVARVSHVVKNVNAAFVEIEKGKKCFLPLSDVKNPIYVKRLSGNQLLSQGDELLVQVIREAVKTKEPQVTTNISIPGVYCVATSEDKRIGVSGKLDEGTRSRLRDLAQRVYDERMGIIIRTNAADVSEEILKEEIRNLQQQLLDIISYAPYRTLYSKLYDAQPEYIKILQDQPMDMLEEVVTDDPIIYAELERFGKFYPAISLTQKLRFYADTQLELHKLYSLEVQLERAIQKKIWLKSGANLVIEPTEAMTVIDVNTSKNIKKKTSEDQYLLVNLEAAHEIARQLRLRNISGIIMIDFIDMVSDKHKELLLSEMRKLVRSDSVKTSVIDLTKLGLMEITRQKVRRPLLEQLTEKKNI